MSNAEAPISFTTKIAGDLFTIRGDDPATFLTRLEAFNMFPTVANFIAQYNGEQAIPAAITDAFPDATVATPNTGQGNTGIPTCAHGQRVHRKGTSQKGPWSAWFCPTDKDDPNKCKPVFV